MKVVYFSIAILIGMLVIVQASANSALRKIMNNALHAAIANFLVGILALLLYALVTKQTSMSLSFSSAKWWHWVGGLIGAGYVIGVILLVPHLGTLGLFSSLIAGQLIASALIDHFGWLGVPQKP
ncbi:MAG: DMT family transporter, partial [Flammeovirgaceae bacterium]|nr:DMT family transporter [Flammeovirgaceae bacterium]MDW8289060.1 DMT family transporter [Flammeovirgaceae bacterium]